MGRMAGQARPLLNRSMGQTAGKGALLVAGITKVCLVGDQEILCILRVRVMTGSAFAGDDRLMLYS